MHQTVFHVVKYTVIIQTTSKYTAVYTKWNQNAICNFVWLDLQSSHPNSLRIGTYLMWSVKLAFSARKNDTFSAKMQYMEKYPSLGGLASWPVWMKFSFTYPWPNWRHHPLGWWGIFSVRRTAAYYKGFVQSILLQIREGPRSGPSVRMVVKEYCDHGFHWYNSFLTSFLSVNLPAAFTNIQISACPALFRARAPLSHLCSFGYHNIKEDTQLLESSQMRICEDCEQSQGSLMRNVWGHLACSAWRKGKPYCHLQHHQGKQRNRNLLVIGILISFIDALEPRLILRI